MIQTTYTCTHYRSNTLRRMEVPQKLSVLLPRLWQTLNSQVGYTEEQKAEILCAYQEGSSLRGIEVDLV